MKKVLILSYFSPPGNFAGSYRIKSWVDYFHLFNYNPILITRHWNENETDFSGISIEKEKIVTVSKTSEIHFLPYNGSLKSQFLRFSKNKFQIVAKMIGFLEIILQNHFILFCSYKNLYKEAREVMMQNPDINLLIVSGRPFLLFRFAYLLKKEFPRLKWIADYRDPWTTSLIKKDNFRLKFIGFVERFLEKRWVNSAAFFTTSSEVLIKQIRRIIKVHGYVIKNGFDDKYYASRHIPPSTSSFDIVYNGTLYPSQPIEVFLDGFIRFLNQGQIKSNLVFIGADLYFNNEKRLAKYLNQTHGKIKLLPRVKQEKLFEILSNAQICLLTNYSGNYGVYTAKLFDYLASGAPLILCPTDNDVLAQTIKETNTGFIVNTSEEVSDLLSQLYNEWLRKGSIPFSPNHKEIQKYSRKAQAEILCGYLDKISLYE